MISMNPERVQMVERIKVDLRKKCVVLSTDTIETVLDFYDKRLAKELRDKKTQDQKVRELYDVRVVPEL